jgi:hypothetical protein
MMTTAPYDPRSGNMPDAKPLDIAGMRYQAQYNPSAPANQPTYNTERIYDNRGNLVNVYTEGPNAGRGVDNGELVIQGEKPVYNDISGLTSDRSNNGEGVVGYIPKGGIGSISGEMQDAYQRLYDEFNILGLGALVQDSKDLIMKATSIAAIPDALRNTQAYQTRFSANDARIKAGLRAISPAEYLRLEDQYQNIMRSYGLPASYYTPGQYGKQEGFEKLIASDISSTELEDRVSTAQKRVLNSNPQVLDAIKSFYGDSITNGDILAYTLDPKNAIENIKRKVTAAEIGGAALSQTDAMGKPILTTSEARARELANYGVNKESATAGYSTIGAGLQRGSELAAIYGESPYTQATAESEIFKLSGQQEARKQRQKVTGLEKATFGGQSGLTSGALARDRAGGI